MHLPNGPQKLLALAGFLTSLSQSIALNLRPYQIAADMWTYLRWVCHQENDARHFHLEYDTTKYNQGEKKSARSLLGIHDIIDRVLISCLCQCSCGAPGSYPTNTWIHSTASVYDEIIEKIWTCICEFIKSDCTFIRSMFTRITLWRTEVLKHYWTSKSRALFPILLLMHL